MEAISYVEARDADLDQTQDVEFDLGAVGLEAPSELDLEAGWAIDRSRISVLGTSVDVISGEEVLGLLSSRARSQLCHLCYVNAHSLNLAWGDGTYRSALARADLVLNDGIGLDLAARMRGIRFRENLNGSDFTIRLLELAALEGWRVYLYGGRPGVARKAAKRLTSSIDGLEIVGV